MADFFPEKPAEQTLPNATKNTNQSKKDITDANEQVDIEIIKTCLLQNLTEDQIANKLGCHRTTISRKISKWMKTEDFDEWIDKVWLTLGIELSQTEEGKVEVYKQLTRLKCAKQTRKIEAKQEITEKIEGNVTITNDLLSQYAKIIQQEQEDSPKT
jgi:transcriptional regulator with XRE-family HTH domain